MELVPRSRSKLEQRTREIIVSPSHIMSDKDAMISGSILLNFSTLPWNLNTLTRRRRRDGRFVKCQARNLPNENLQVLRSILILPYIEQLSIPWRQEKIIVELEARFVQKAIAVEVASM